jgi:hypothetical protein
MDQQPNHRLRISQIRRAARLILEIKRATRRLESIVEEDFVDSDAETVILEDCEPDTEEPIPTLVPIKREKAAAIDVRRY